MNTANVFVYRIERNGYGPFNGKNFEDFLWYHDRNGTECGEKFYKHPLESDDETFRAMYHEQFPQMAFSCRPEMRFGATSIQNLKNYFFLEDGDLEILESFGFEVVRYTVKKEYEWNDGFQSFFNSDFVTEKDNF